MDKAYTDTVRLLLEIAPEVFQAECFAMKGGTALTSIGLDLVAELRSLRNPCVACFHC